MSGNFCHKSHKSMIFFLVECLVSLRSVLATGDGVARRLQSHICQDEVSFQERVMTESADGDSAIFAIDLDGDGDVDVLSASPWEDRIMWYNNQGGSPPTFEKMDISVDANRARSVFAIDLDGDGDIDVLSASSDDSKIAWFESDGGSPPNFEKKVITETADGANSVFAVDVDGDGDIDVLSASSDDDTIAWYENDGGITPNFEQRVIVDTADGANSVFAIDLDGDGDVDVLSTSFEDDTIAWYENDGSSPPNFEKIVIASTADGAMSVFAMDMDGDGNVDVLSASSDDNTIAWYKNDGGSPPSFEEKVLTETADGANSVFAIDVDGDGDVDVLSTSENDDTIAWYESDGGAQAMFVERTITSTLSGAASVFAVDLDGDGDVDVLSGSVLYSMITWYESNCGSSGSTPTVKPTSPPPSEEPAPSLQPTTITTMTSTPSTRHLPNADTSPQPTEQPTNIETSAQSTDSTDSASLSKHFWEIVGTIIGIMGIVIPTLLWWMDKRREYPQRRCCPRVHFFFFDCCKPDNRDYNTYRELYQPTAPAIAGLLQHVQNLFGVMDSDGDGLVTQGRFLMTLREFPELADFFKLPHHIEQEGPSRAAFAGIFRYIADTNSDFDEARWRSRTAQFHKQCLKR